MKKASRKTKFVWLKEWNYRDACGYSWRLDIFTNAKQDKFQIWRDGKPVTSTVFSEVESAMREAEYLIRQDNARHHDRLRSFG